LHSRRLLLGRALTTQHTTSVPCTHTSGREGQTCAGGQAGTPLRMNNATNSTSSFAHRLLVCEPRYTLATGSCCQARPQPPPLHVHRLSLRSSPGWRQSHHTHPHTFCTPTHGCAFPLAAACSTLPSPNQPHPTNHVCAWRVVNNNPARLLVKSRGMGAQHCSNGPKPAAAR
jgi:hypothetical protein